MTPLWEHLLLYPSSEHIIRQVYFQDRILNHMKHTLQLTLLISLLVFATSCVTDNSSRNSAPVTTSSVSPSPTPPTEAVLQPITLPVLDAFFTTDDSFANALKTQVGLTEEEITAIRRVAREETGKLREYQTDRGSTEASRQLAHEQIARIIGGDKTAQLFHLARERWRSGEEAGKPKESEVESQIPNAVPTDTRVVVNSPAYRMDVFENGRLVKSYKIGIGYPEFPLPTGLRKARAIIFNPTWTPPDEPWVESPSSKVKVGQRIEAGSKLNPLGLLKIPIGSPSLIHGGKSPAKIGTFASHGCVGLTDAQVQDFAKLLAKVAGAKLTDADLAEYRRNRQETKQVTLSQPVLVELRYETIVAADGQLHIYRDVYDRNTNTEENLRAVFEANNISLEDLTEDERAQVIEALEQMSQDASGKPDDANGRESASPTVSPSPKKNQSGRVTRSFKGKKEVVIEIAALKGKGYPAMASAGSTPKTTSR